MLTLFKSKVNNPIVLFVGATVVCRSVVSIVVGFAIFGAIVAKTVGGLGAIVVFTSMGF